MKVEGCDDVAVNICRWIFPGTWAANIAASWRISPDIRPRWSSVKDIIGLNTYLAAYCRNGKLKLRNLINRKNLESVSNVWTATVQPHGVLIAKAEGEQRLEATRYEAEWAFLPKYDGSRRQYG